LGEYEEACRLLREAVNIVQRLGYSHAIARALIRLSGSVLATGVRDPRAYDEAKALAEQSLQLSKLNEDLPATAHGIYLLGLIALHRGTVAEAPAWFHQCLEIYHTIGDQWSRSRVLNSLGEAQHHLGDPAAPSTFRQAARSAIGVEAMPQLLEALAGLAAIALHEEHYARALGIAYVVEQHPHINVRTKERINQVRQRALERLTIEEVAAIKAQSSTQPFETLVETILLKNNVQERA
jgi:hypothetical protein